MRNFRLPGKGIVASSRRRGLKHPQRPQYVEFPSRLFTEAWIETLSMNATLRVLAVASSRRRGLKHIAAGQTAAVTGRLFTEAWIETCNGVRVVIDQWSPLHGGVD